MIAVVQHSCRMTLILAAAAVLSVGCASKSDDSNQSDNSTSSDALTSRTHANGVFAAAALSSVDAQVTLSVGVQVNDDELRKHLPDGFDGQERPFVLIPYRHGVEPVWSRVDLGYQRTISEGGPTFDYYGVRQAVTSEESGVIQTYGLAFGVDTNRGTIWLQDSGHNLVPGTD